MTTTNKHKKLKSKRLSWEDLQHLRNRIKEHDEQILSYEKVVQETNLDGNGYRAELEAKISSHLQAIKLLRWDLENNYSLAMAESKVREAKNNIERVKRNVSVLKKELEEATIIKHDDKVGECEDDFVS